jgi:hypothetical protein
MCFAFLSIRCIMYIKLNLQLSVKPIIFGSLLQLITWANWNICSNWSLYMIRYLQLVTGVNWNSCSTFSFYLSRYWFTEVRGTHRSPLIIFLHRESIGYLPHQQIISPHTWNLNYIHWFSVTQEPILCGCEPNSDIGNPPYAWDLNYIHRFFIIPEPIVM